MQDFFGLSGHVTVEELVARARRNDPRVSVATVYRTMKLLVDCGLASARQFGDGQTRYEPSAGRAHHDHLICTVCGDIVEFANEKIESLQETIARRHGFEVERHKLELYGRCARCRGARRGAPLTPPAPAPASARAGDLDKKQVIASNRAIILVGNPNVGKSVLFGALTGKYVTVSNYPGTTVEVTRVRRRSRVSPGT